MYACVHPHSLSLSLSLSLSPPLPLPLHQKTSCPSPSLRQCSALVLWNVATIWIWCPLHCEEIGLLLIANNKLGLESFLATLGNYADHISPVYWLDIHLSPDLWI